MRTLAVLVVVVALAGAAAAFRRGDPIPVSDRVNFNGQTSAWGEILLMRCPRFMTPKTVVFDGGETLRAMEYGVEADGAAGTTGEVKIMLSFDHGAIVSPWLLLTDGTGALWLNWITITFHYSGHDIVDVNIEPDYSDADEHNGTVPDGTFTVHYKWVEDHEVDTIFGLAMLFGCGFALIFCMVMMTVLDIAALRNQVVASIKNEVRNFRFSDMFEPERGAPAPSSSSAPSSAPATGFGGFQTDRSPPPTVTPSPTPPPPSRLDAGPPPVATSFGSPLASSARPDAMVHTPATIDDDSWTSSSDPEPEPIPPATGSFASAAGSGLLSRGAGNGGGGGVGFRGGASVTPRGKDD